MYRAYYLLLLILFACVACEWQLPSSEEDGQITVDRYDRIQSQYLTTGDFAALQQMNTVYPMQTRTLIEDVLRIGKVDDQQINTKFLRFYQDSTLQTIIAEAEQQYANMDDINHQLTHAFSYLRKILPEVASVKTADFDYDLATGRYVADPNDLTIGGDLQYNSSTGVLTLPAGKTGTLTLAFGNADFSNVSKVKMSREGDDLFNTLMY